MLALVMDCYSVHTQTCCRSVNIFILVSVSFQLLSVNLSVDISHIQLRDGLRVPGLQNRGRELVLLQQKLHIALGQL